MRADLLMQTGFYSLRSLPLARKRCINLFPQISEDSSFSKISLMGTPGIKEFADAQVSGSSRGCIVANGIPYYVVGNSFISISSVGVVTNHGTISGACNVKMSFNTKTIAIVCPDSNSYFFTVATSTLAQITDPIFLEFGQVTYVNYKKGYFVFNTDEVFFNSSVFDTNNGQSFDAIDFDIEEIAPDKITATFTSHDQLYVLGRETCAIYDNITTTLFPFAEIEGANLEIGCTARMSITKFANDFIFIGGGKNENPAVWRVSGTGIARMSTDAVEYIMSLAAAEELENAVVDTYSLDGHVFACFTVGKYSLEYDDTASAIAGYSVWHERQSGITNGETFKRWRGQNVCKAYGKLFVGDHESAKIGYLDMDTYYEFGERIERVVISQPVAAKAIRMYQGMIEMFIETGVGNSDSENPAWLFSYSDNGKTWTNAVSRFMGKVGEYSIHLIWNRLGSYTVSRVFRFKTDDPVKIAVYKWESEVG